MIPDWVMWAAFGGTLAFLVALHLETLRRRRRLCRRYPMLRRKRPEPVFRAETAAPEPEPTSSPTPPLAPKPEWSWLRRKWNAFRAWRKEYMDIRGIDWKRFGAFCKSCYSSVEDMKPTFSFIGLVVILLLSVIFLPGYLSFKDPILGYLVSLVIGGIGWFILNNLFRKAGEDIPLEDMSPDEAAQQAGHLGNLQKIKKARKDLGLGKKETTEDKEKKELEKRRDKSRLEAETLEAEKEAAYIKEHGRPPPWSKRRGGRKKNSRDEGSGDE